MTILTGLEMKMALELFESGGHVLDFTNATYAAFFRSEVGIDIYDDAYAIYGTSKGKRLRAFLEKAQPAGVRKILVSLWGYRQMTLRISGEADPLIDFGTDLSALIVRLGGKPLTLSPVPTHSASEAEDAVDHAALMTSLREIMTLAPHPRGFAFEKFLKGMFDAWRLDARKAFKIIGEQIDGSFQLGDATVLLEAKWQNNPVDLITLQGFQGRLEDRPIWTRGLFISYGGFSVEALHRFQTRRVVLMDGLDLHDLLDRKLSLKDVISAKSRRASETGQGYVPVRDLFPS